MREPCIRDLQVSGIVGHDDQFAELAAGLATGEKEVPAPRQRDTCTGVAAVIEPVSRRRFQERSRGAASGSPSGSIETGARGPKRSQ